MNPYPYPLDINDSLSKAELAVLRSQYDKESGNISVQTKFNYGWGLVKSNNESEQENGIKLLLDIFHEAPERRRECLYYLSLANFKLKRYDEAKEHIKMLLQLQPSNSQAQNLQKSIDYQVTKEGYIGLSLLGGAVITASILGTFLIRKSSRN